MPIPIKQPIPEQIAFNHPTKEVDGIQGLLLAINQRLGGVAPSRGETFYKPFADNSAQGFIFTKDPMAKVHGIVGLKASQAMQQGAETFVTEAMGATQSQDQQVLMKYIRERLLTSGLLQ